MPKELESNSIYTTFDNAAEQLTSIKEDYQRNKFNDSHFASFETLLQNLDSLQTSILEQSGQCSSIDNHVKQDGVVSQKQRLADKADNDRAIITFSHLLDVANAILNTSEPYRLSHMWQFRFASKKETVTNEDIRLLNEFTISFKTWLKNRDDTNYQDLASKYTEMQQHIDRCHRGKTKAALNVAWFALGLSLFALMFVGMMLLQPVLAPFVLGAIAYSIASLFVVVLPSSIAGAGSRITSKLIEDRYESNAEPIRHLFRFPRESLKVTRQLRLFDIMCNGSPRSADGSPVFVSGAVETGATVMQNHGGALRLKLLRTG